MKFGKFKLNRCKNCLYYKKLGNNIHFCIFDKYIKHPMDYESNCHGYRIIPLICFNKKSIKKEE